MFRSLTWPVLRVDVSLTQRSALSSVQPPGALLSTRQGRPGEEGGLVLPGWAELGHIWF